TPISTCIQELVETCGADATTTSTGLMWRPSMRGCEAGRSGSAAYCTTSDPGKVVFRDFRERGLRGSFTAYSDKSLERFRTRFLGLISICSDTEAAGGGISIASTFSTIAFAPLGV